MLPGSHSHPTPTSPSPPYIPVRLAVVAGGRTVNGRGHAWFVLERRAACLNLHCCHAAQCLVLSLLLRGALLRLLLLLLPGPHVSAAVSWGWLSSSSLLARRCDCQPYAGVGLLDGSGSREGGRDWLEVWSSRHGHQATQAPHTRHGSQAMRLPCLG